jgi:predicted ester cyclase
VLNTGNFSSADEFCAPDYIEHSTPPGMPGNLQGVEEIFGILHSAFPDFKYVVEEIIAEGDKVGLKITASGTLQGPIFGNASTGKHGEWPEIHIVRVQDSKLAEHRDVKDTAIRARQLGLGASAANSQ